MVEKTMENIEAQTLIQRGFTLIKIISVLVTLGVLAAVAVPKYIDLQRDAQNKALLSVKSEAQARMNLLFSQNVMNGKTYTHSAVPTDTMCQKMWFSAYNNFTYGSGGLENVGENMTIGSYLVTLSPLKPNYSVLKVAFLKDDKNIVPQGVDMTREPWIIKSPCEE